MLLGWTQRTGYRGDVWETWLSFRTNLTKSSREVVMVKPLFVIVQSVCLVFWDCLLCQLIIVSILLGWCVLCLIQSKFLFSVPAFSLSFGFHSMESAMLSFLHSGLWTQHSRIILGYFGDLLGRWMPQEDVTRVFLRPSKTTGHHKRTHQTWIYCPLYCTSCTVPW